MRQFLIVIAVVALAHADDLSENEVSAPFECVVKTATGVVDKNVNELLEFLKSLNPSDSAKQTTSKLREERDALKAALKSSAEKANSDQSECLEKAKKQGGLFPNTRCILTSKAKFVINAGGAISNFGIKVTRIILDDNVNFHGDNLSRALEVMGKQLQAITKGLTDAMRCFQ